MTNEALGRDSLARVACHKVKLRAKQREIANQRLVLDARAQRNVPRRYELRPPTKRVTAGHAIRTMRPCVPRQRAATATWRGSFLSLHQ